MSEIASDLSESMSGPDALLMQAAQMEFRTVSYNHSAYGWDTNAMLREIVRLRAQIAAIHKHQSETPPDELYACNDYEPCGCKNGEDGHCMYCLRLKDVHHDALGRDILRAAGTALVEALTAETIWAICPACDRELARGHKSDCALVAARRAFGVEVNG